MNEKISTTRDHLAHPKYRPDIDGLRAVAVLSVVGFHAFPGWVPGGFVGVDIFFVISGFLISSIIFESLEQQKFSYPAFYAKRVRRIFPALILVLASSLIFGWFALLADEFAKFGKHLLGGATFLSNFTLWHEEGGYFDGSSDSKPLLHLWSLAIEEQFYIVWPLLMGFVWKRKWNFLAITLLIAITSFAFNIWTVHNNLTAAFYSPWCRFWELMVGGVLAYLVLHKPRFLSIHPNWQSLFGLSLVFLGIGLIDRQRVFPGWWALLPTLGAALTISATPRAFLNRKLLGNPIFVWVGLISYPLYLWHWVLLSFARIVAGETPSFSVRLAAVLASILLAYMTYRLIERPVRFSSDRKYVPLVLCGALFGLGGCGYISLREDGFEFRNVNRFAASFNPNSYRGTRESDGSCERDLNKRTVADEVCLTSSKEPEYLILGDSHAMAFSSAAHLKLVEMNALLVAGHSCALFTNVIQLPANPQQKYGQNCMAIAKDAIEMAHLGSIKTILVVNMAPAFDGADASKVIYKDDEDRVLTPRDAYLKGSSGMLESLLATGKRIVFVSDVPRLPNEPRDCISRLFQKDSRACDLPKADFEKSRSEYRDVLAQFKQTFPELLFFDAANIICNDDECFANDDTDYYYHDSHHLSSYGSKKELSEFLTRFN